MRRIVIIVTALVMFCATAAQARRPHSIKLGKSLPVKLFLGPTDENVVDMVVRPLLVDGEIRDFTVGEMQDITEDTFVIQRAYRLNDRLPEDPESQAKWKWQKGPWLLVDRDSGRVKQLDLPDFDPFYSTVSWYQDYAAYCGLSSDGEMVSAVVFKVGDKRPLLDRELHRAKGGNNPDAECAAPDWDRKPARVTFLPTGMQKMTFQVNGRVVDPYAPEQPAEAQSAQPAGAQPPSNPEQPR